MKMGSYWGDHQIVKSILTFNMCFSALITSLNMFLCDEVSLSFNNCSTIRIATETLKWDYILLQFTFESRL